MRVLLRPLVMCAGLLACNAVPPVIAGAAQPQVFAPFDLPAGAGFMDVAFTRDGQTLYVTLYQKTGNRYAIAISHRVAGHWSAPAAVAFSGTYRDLEEVLAPDSSFMIFASNRPIVPGGRRLDAFYHGVYSPGAGGNLWIVRRAGTGWGTPERLPDVINANTSVFSPAVAADGTLYFMRATGAKGAFHLFVSHPVNGTYTSVQAAPFASARFGEFDPAVASDGSFVVFSSTRPPAVLHKSAHAFISYNRDGRWTQAADLGMPINAGGDDTEARLSPDGKVLYYSSGFDPANPGANSRKATRHVLFLALP
jgi:WD40-like Beta Propeller Repeat